MRQVIVMLGIALLFVTGVALGGCDGGDSVALWEASREDDDCEQKPTCETLGFGSHPEY
ncbi:MAG: hypothetical protein O7G88_22755 [bacterium]|nr:hypothetical protein [bacterium]